MWWPKTETVSYGIAGVYWLWPLSQCCSTPTNNSDTVGRLAAVQAERNPVHHIFPECVYMTSPQWTLLLLLRFDVD